MAAAAGAVGGSFGHYPRLGIRPPLGFYEYTPTNLDSYVDLAFYNTA
jgi:hypothetical protein